VPRRSRRLRRPRHVIATRVGAGIIVLLVTVTLATSFTASTNVPVSHAGTSAETRLIMQLAPAGCTSLSLTVLVQGSGTFSNSQSHALVLGMLDADWPKAGEQVIFITFHTIIRRRSLRRHPKLTAHSGSSFYRAFRIK